MGQLSYIERAAADEPEGLLILHHGRGSNEQDLIGLADVLDPDGRLHVVSVRAPMRLEGMPGFHWYRVPRVGYPDPQTFDASLDALGELHDHLWEQLALGPEKTVLGGFSMGTVMSYAAALSESRPVPAGVLAFSGFIPTVSNWEPSWSGRDSLRVHIAHGNRDPVISVEFARSARGQLSRAGIDVTYRESGVAHQIDPEDLSAAANWLPSTI